MNQSFKPGPLIRLLLLPLVFTIDKTSEGIIAGIGLFLIYPLLDIISQIVKEKMPRVDSFYIISFLGVFLGGLYILIAGVIDWRFYERFVFIFPISMTSSVLLFSLLGVHDHKKPSPIIEGFIGAFFIIIFALVRDYYTHGAIDLRFGPFGSIYTFGIDTPFKNREIIVSSKNAILFPIFQLRASTFFIAALLIGLMGSFYKKGE